MRHQTRFKAAKSGLPPTHLFRHFCRYEHGSQTNDGTNSPALRLYAYFGRNSMYPSLLVKPGGIVKPDGRQQFVSVLGCAALRLGSVGDHHAVQIACPPRPTRRFWTKRAHRLMSHDRGACLGMTPGAGCTDECSSGKVTSRRGGRVHPCNRSIFMDLPTKSDMGCFLS